MQALVMAHAYAMDITRSSKIISVPQAGLDSSIVDYPDLRPQIHYRLRRALRRGRGGEAAQTPLTALMNYGVDRYKRPQKISLQEEKARQEEPRGVSAKR